MTATRLVLVLGLALVPSAPVLMGCESCSFSFGGRAYTIHAVSTVPARNVVQAQCASADPASCDEPPVSEVARGDCSDSGETESEACRRARAGTMDIVLDGVTEQATGGTVGACTYPSKAVRITADNCDPVLVVFDASSANQDTKRAAMTRDVTLTCRP